MDSLFLHSPPVSGTVTVNGGNPTPADVGPGGPALWGNIGGDINEQADLIELLGDKADSGELAAHINDDQNPHSVTAAQINLGNVANLAPADYPISALTQTALNTKTDDDTLGPLARLGLPGGTTNFLRGDGVFAVPPGGGGPTVAIATQQSKVSSAFAEVYDRPVRVLLSGTSIASFDRSSVRVAAANLQIKYGRNNTEIYQFALSGGNYNTDNLGRQKQVYGGSPYIRMAMKPADPSFTMSRYCNGFRLVYGRETDGGAFSVTVRITLPDGTNSEITTNITSNGAQEYERMLEQVSTQKQWYTITINPPATGWAYLSRLEMVDTGPGIFIEDGTMGGAGLHNTQTLFSMGSPDNKPGIAIVGNVGMDAWFGRTGALRPDLIIMEQFTNEPSAAAMAPPLARMATMTVAAGQPITAVAMMNEMPAMDFINLDGTLIAARVTIRDLMASYASRPNIAYIDWIAMVDFSNRAAYEARYFPGPDKTHPDENGYYPTHSAFSDLFNVENPGYTTIGAMPGSFAPVTAEGVNPFSADPYALRKIPVGAVRDSSNPYGSITPAVGRAVNFTTNSVSANVFVSSTLPNLLPPSAIVFDDGVDPAYGPYKDYNDDVLGEIMPLTNVGVNDDFTLLLLAQSTVITHLVGMRMTNPGNNDAPKVTVNGVVVDTSGSPKTSYLPRDRPVFVYITIRRGLPDLEFRCRFSLENMRLYGAWAVEGAVPMMTTKMLDSPYRGFPVYATADPVVSASVPGQIYHYASPVSGTRKVRAQDTVVYKPLTQTFHRGYELLNRDNTANNYFVEMGLTNPTGTLAYNDRAGGLLYPAIDNYRAVLPFAAAGQTMTLGLRTAGHIVGIYMEDAGGGNRVSLNDAGAWVNGSSLMFLPQINTNHMNCGFTFALPTGAQATALGTTPTVIYETVAGLGGYGVATLAAGPCAIINSN